LRVKVNITGIVQGVGFRPFVYRTAVKNGLAGYVRNRGDAGVEILIEGDEQRIQNFLRDLREKKPPLAQIHDIITTTLAGKNEHAKLPFTKAPKKPSFQARLYRQT